MLATLEKQLGYAGYAMELRQLRVFHSSRYSLPGACPSMPFYQQTPECASDHCVGWPQGGP